MSTYEVGKLIHDMFTDKDVRSEFKKDPELVISRYKLTQNEKGMIIKRDYIALYESGVHPVLLFHFAQTLDVRDNFIKDVTPRLAGVKNAYYEYYSQQS